MNAQQLSRQLRRELVANPKKAAVLGLLVVVAIYFWGPLVWKWTQGDARAVASAAAVVPPGGAAGKETAVPAGSPVVNNASAAKPVSPVARPPWQQLVAWMEGDTRMRPAAAVPLVRDPFGLPKAVRAAEDQRKNEPKEKPKVETTPESVGLVVSSTVVGISQATAVINGKAYQPGCQIKVAKNGEDVVFELVEVHPRRVVLARDGKQFELVIVRPKSKGRIDLRGKHD